MVPELVAELAEALSKGGKLLMVNGGSDIHINLAI
jgi:hypothetical protein